MVHGKKGNRSSRKLPYRQRHNLSIEEHDKLAFENLEIIKKNVKFSSINKLINSQLKARPSCIKSKASGTGNYNKIFKESDADITKSKENSAKAYYKVFSQVVEEADVIIQVLDARDPMGSRTQDIEDKVNLKGKLLVLLLNKADLVPKSNLRDWLKALRFEYPTAAFQSSTQLQSKHLGQLKIKPTLLGENFKTSLCVGAHTLMQLLRKLHERITGSDDTQIKADKKTQRDIKVGVVGMPNVGKSSVINSLKRSRACNVGRLPGITKSMQEVRIDSKLVLLDCPGLVLSTKSEDTSDAMHALKNAVNIDTLDDPVSPVQAILTKAGHENMCKHYNMPVADEVNKFLAMLSQRRGKLLKGGRMDLRSAAKIVLNDWNSGKIKYYTNAPILTGQEVNESKMFGFEYEYDDSEIKDIHSRDVNTIPIISKSSEPMDIEMNEEDKSLISSETCIEVKQDDDDIMIVEEEKKPRWETKRKNVDLSIVSLRKVQKKDKKRMQKEKRRNMKRAEDLASVLQEAL